MEGSMSVWRYRKVISSALWDVRSGLRLAMGKIVLRDDRGDRRAETADITPFQDMCQKSPGLRYWSQQQGRWPLSVRNALYGIPAYKIHSVGAETGPEETPDSVEGYYKEVMQRIGERPTEDRKRGYEVLSLVSPELERAATCTRGHKVSCRWSLGRRRHFRCDRSAQDHLWINFCSYHPWERWHCSIASPPFLRRLPAQGRKPQNLVSNGRCRHCESVYDLPESRSSAGTLPRRAFSVQDFKVPFSSVRLAVLGWLCSRCILEFEG